MRVLIVEDQHIILHTLSGLVKELYPKAIISCTTTTVEAMTALKNLSYDIIIADLDFNGEKRFSVVTLAKEYNTKCIIYSAHYNLAFIKRAQELGVVGFISKLGNLEDLKYALKNFNSLEKYVCSYCQLQNKPTESNEILSPNLTAIEETILDKLLIQTPRKEIAKELNITANSLNTYINRMAIKNNCNLLVVIHRYIVWKRSKN